MGGTSIVSIGSSTIGPRYHFLNDGNQAIYGGGIAIDGANGSASVSLTGTSVAGNKGFTDGGGIYSVNGGALVIGAGSTIFSNTPDNNSQKPDRSRPASSRKTVG